LPPATPAPATPNPSCTTQSIVIEQFQASSYVFSQQGSFLIDLSGVNRLATVKIVSGPPGSGMVVNITSARDIVISAQWEEQSESGRASLSIVAGSEVPSSMNSGAPNPMATSTIPSASPAKTFMTIPSQSSQSSGSSTQLSRSAACAASMLIASAVDQHVPYVGVLASSACACLLSSASAISSECDLTIVVSIERLFFMNHTVVHFEHVSDVQCSTGVESSGYYDLVDVESDFRGFDYPLATGVNACVQTSFYKRTAQLSGDEKSCSLSFPEASKVEFGFSIPVGLRVNDRALGGVFAAKWANYAELPISVPGLGKFRLFASDITYARALVSDESMSCSFVYTCVGGVCASSLGGSPFCAVFETTGATDDIDTSMMALNSTCGDGIRDRLNASSIALCLSRLCCPPTSSPQCCGSVRRGLTDSRCAERRQCRSSWGSNCKKTTCKKVCDQRLPCTRETVSVKEPLIVNCSCSAPPAPTQPQSAGCDEIRNTGSSVLMSSPLFVFAIVVSFVANFAQH